MRIALLGCSTLLAIGLLAPLARAQAPSAPAAPPPAYNIRTLGDLAQLCATPESDPNYTSRVSLCVGYGSGVLDYHLIDTAGKNHRGRRVCIPDNAPTRGEVLKQFVSWAQSHPQYADEPAPNGVMRFFITTFPCGKH